MIERLNLTDFTTQLIPFNLRKVVVEGDADQNIPLKPGDSITVFRQSDMQLPAAKRTQTVRIQGEINSPGIYRISVGETLPQLVQRAGGVTGDAYVFGTEVSRKSVREKQKESMRIVIRQLESKLATQSAKVLGQVTPGADVSQIAMLNQRNEDASRVQIKQLQEQSPNGRISLEMNPEAPVIPNFILEDEDEINIPIRPGYVSAAGAVYNDNVLMYHDGNRVSDYLKVAGVKDSAELDDMFVLRADGSITSSRDQNVKKVRVYPGDVIVVPEKYYEESGYSVFMRGLKDWTQVIFQLGLGAAAVHTLQQ